MRQLASVIVAILTLSANGQDWLRTTVQEKLGVKRLELSGAFLDADTVFIQVYHDGKEIRSGVFAGSFALSINGVDYAVVKFTDRKRRVKRMSFYELSDNTIEFVPPFEIDFRRGGNLVYIRGSVGKPDFQEFDVGTSRRQ